MSSNTSAAQLSSSPRAAESFSPTEPTLCVVQIKHQAAGVIHQVVIDPAKIRDGLIRLGDWPGDEANGWQYVDNLTVLLVLGKVERVSNTEITVTPL